MYDSIHEKEERIPLQKTKRQNKNNAGIYLIFANILIFCFLMYIFKFNTHIRQRHEKKNETWIYLIRHNEKYTDQSLGLSLSGEKHAFCLVNYFTNFPFGRPQISFAEKSKEGRAQDTLLPLSFFLNISLLADYDKTKIDHFIKDIYKASVKYNRILIAYEHHFIPVVAQKLGCTLCQGWGMNPLIDKTQGSIFNLTWVFSLHNFKFLYVYEQNYQNETQFCQQSNFLYPYKKYC